MKGALPSLVLVLAVSASSLTAQDVEFIAFGKEQVFVQDNPSIPHLADEDSLSVAAFFSSAQPGLVTNATLQLPSGTNLTLTIGTNREAELEAEFGSLFQLETAFPPGTYTLSVQAVNDGSRAVQLSLPATAYPNVPKISNYAAAQKIDASSDFLLSWDPFVGGLATDLIMIEIEADNGNGGSTVFRTGPPEAPDSLDGTATSINIPPGTFAPNEVYTCSLRFFRLLGVSTAYGNDVPAYTYYSSTTDLRIATLNPSDSTLPTVSRVLPSDNADPRSVISIEFDEAMDTSANVAASIGWSGVGPGAFTYGWSADQRTLFCIAAAGLPPSTSIGFVLNPNSGPANLRDLALNPVAPDTSRDFSTGLDNGSPPDVSMFWIVKSRSYDQDDQAGSQFIGTLFASGANFAAANAVLQTQVQGPTGLSFMEEFSDDNSSNESEFEFPSQTVLDAFFPNGSYTLQFGTAHDGTQSGTLALAGDAYPPAPLLLNFNEAQAIDPDQPFTLQWNVMGGTSDDPVFLRIEDDLNNDVLHSPETGDPGSLNAAGPSEFTIPAGTLSPGRTYEISLDVLNLTDTDDTSYPGAMGLAAYAVTLEVAIRTTGTPPSPTLAASPMFSDDFQFMLEGENNRSYAIDCSSDARTWHSLGVRIAYGGSLMFFDYDSQNYSTRFYRARDFSWQNGVLIEGSVRSSQTGLPIAWAIVSTSLDSATAITDVNGNFSLAAGVTGDFGNTPYNIAAQAEGYEPLVLNGQWGNQPSYVQLDL